MIAESDYPEALANALQHAEALSCTLAEPELMARLDRWAIGRGEEIARFVELVVGDWRMGALSENACYAGRGSKSARRAPRERAPRMSDGARTAAEPDSAASPLDRPSPWRPEHVVPGHLELGSA